MVCRCFIPHNPWSSTATKMTSPETERLRFFFTNSKAQAANVAGGSSAVVSSLRGNANSFVLSYPTSGQVTRNYVCSPPYGYSSCSNIGASDCPSGYRDSYVRTRSSTCNKNDVCGTCYGTAYVTKAC
eukprot:PhF_6_TR35361/c1_g1_i4/m.51337